MQEEYRDIFNRIENTLRRVSNLSTEQFDLKFGEFKYFENRILSDEDYFNRIIGIVFYSGFRAERVNRRLDTIRTHFPNYNAVADYDENKIEQILSDANMIRNRKKVEACIENAKIFKEIISKYDSFDSYVESFKLKESFENLMLFKEDIEYKFPFLGGITVYHFMMDIGLPVLKPDRVITRIFKRLELIENEKQYLKTVIQGRKFSRATGHPVRYVDIIFVKYGQKGEDVYFGLKHGICLEKDSKCKTCGVKNYCGYYADNSR